MIPTKKSKQWIGVFILYTVVIFIGLIATKVMLHNEIIGAYIFGSFLISLGSAIISCIGGFLGKRIFFLVYTLSVMIGILYMFYVVLVNTSPGWGDLTSIIGYLFIVGVGTVLAFVMELIIYFIKRKKIPSNIH